MEIQFRNIDEYILLFPEGVQQQMEQIRKTIHSEGNLEEYIGYQMPAFRYKKKPLVYFAGYKKHIGFYPGEEGIRNFEAEFKQRNYKFSKGAVQLPVNEDIPLDLIRKIVRSRMQEIESKKS